MYKWKSCSILTASLVIPIIATLGNPTGLWVDPEGPILAKVGNTISINCSQPVGTGPDLVWRLPYNIEVSSHTIVKTGSKQGVFSSQWLHNVLQLTITKVEEADAGTYTCRAPSGLIPSRAVRVWVLPLKNQTSPCSHTQFRCGTGNCIFQRFRCDRIPNCPDYSDEMDCEDLCKGKFECASGQCVSPLFHCDRNFDCEDGSDETHCGYKDYTGLTGRGLSHTPVKAHDPDAVMEDHPTWHFNAIYSGVAAIVGLLCVITVIVITVMRIHMRRESLRQQNQRQQRLQQRLYQVPGHRSKIYRSRCFGSHTETPPSAADDAYSADTLLPPHCVMSTNLAVSINLQLSSAGLPEFVPKPPPYWEVGCEPTLPREGTPPPPYASQCDIHLTDSDG